MSEIIFEEATLDELLDYLASMEESAVEEVRERIEDIKSELEQQCDDSDRELQDALNHLATIKEKARAAVSAPYDDTGLQIGIGKALRELGEVL